MNNLLDNAIAYTDAGGQGDALGSGHRGRTVRLSVEDTGIGIPAEYLPHVFEKFFRVPGNSQTPGTGLGLAIVREIVTAHGGEITCESQPGKRDGVSPDPAGVEKGHDRKPTSAAGRSSSSR